MGRFENNSVISATEEFAGKELKASGKMNNPEHEYRSKYKVIWGRVSAIFDEDREKMGHGCGNCTSLVKRRTGKLLCGNENVRGADGSLPLIPNMEICPFWGLKQKKVSSKEA